MSKRVLLLGANRSNVLSIRSARQAGFFVMAADPTPHAAGLLEADLAFEVDVRDCARLTELVRQHGGVDGIVSMSEVGVLPAVQIAAQLQLPALSEMAACQARSKAAMRRLWNGLPFSTEFAVAATAEEAEQAAPRLGFPLIFKPDCSFGGSRGVSRVNSGGDVADAFRFAVESGLPGSVVVIERFVSGTEHSCEVLIHEGRASVLCIGQKVKSAQPYRVDVSVQYPARLSIEQQRMVERMAEAAVSAIGLTRGAAHIEFAYTSAGPVLFELGARCGGGHTPELAHAVSGVQEFVEVCRMACGLSPTQIEPRWQRGGDYRFIIFPQGKVAHIEIPAAVRDHPGVIDVEVLARPGSEIGELRTTSNRAGFVVTSGKDYAEAGALADWASRNIIATYEDGRAACALPLNSFGKIDSFGKLD
jgi:biotin carboxylase